MAYIVIDNFNADGSRTDPTVMRIDTDEQREAARAIVNTMRTDGTVTVAGCVAMLAVTPSERVTIVAGDETLSGGSFTLESFARRIALT